MVNLATTKLIEKKQTNHKTYFFGSAWENLGKYGNFLGKQLDCWFLGGGFTQWMDIFPAGTSTRRLLFPLATAEDFEHLILEEIIDLPSGFR